MTGQRHTAGEVDELFAELWQVPRFSGQRRGHRPQCDCYRTDKPPALHVVLELPGVDPDAVEIVADGSALVVCGSRPRPNVSGARYHQLEIEYGPFERRLELGVAIDVERASTSLEHGMLHIELELEER